MRAIVTVKFDNVQPEYVNGRLFKTVGVCPASSKDRPVFCTDVYGKHHSYIEEGEDFLDVERKANQKFKHITRIEIIEEREPTVGETVGELYEKYRESYKKAYGYYP